MSAAAPAEENRTCEPVDLSYTRPASIPHVINHAVSSGLIHDDNPVALFMDLTRLRAKAEAMHAAFPAEANVMHAYAVKANPIARIITELMSLGGGAECASIVEVEQALKVGCDPAKIIFDSPCKTPKELRRCFELGVLCNLDCLEEVEKIVLCSRTVALWLSCVTRSVSASASIHRSELASSSVCRLRQRPANSVRLGIPSGGHPGCLRYTLVLTGVHCHVVSQGCAIQMLVDGVKSIVDLAEEINKIAGEQRVKILDIGGGLPMNYLSDEETPTFEDYASELQKQIPEMWIPGKYEICTEFGRTVVQKAGWLLSKVEYTKMAGGRKIATIHAGSNMFLRTAYLPSTWVHEMSIHLPDGTPKTEADGPVEVCDVAGPLCFSGDLMAVERPLPAVNSGDYLVMHDAGGYTVSMYSRYNSRPCPPVYAYYSDKPTEVFCIKRAETCEEVLEFWAE